MITKLLERAFLIPVLATVPGSTDVEGSVTLIGGVNASPSSTVTGTSVLHPDTERHAGSMRLAIVARPTYNEEMEPQRRPDFTAMALAVGIRVEQERTARGMTKEALAERAGISSQYIWRLEDGRQNVTLKQLVVIADGLDIPLSTLMTDIDRIAAAPPPRPPRKPRGPTAAAKRAALAEEAES